MWRETFFLTIFPHKTYNNLKNIKSHVLTLVSFVTFNKLGDYKNVFQVWYFVLCLKPAPPPPFLSKGDHSNWHHGPVIANIPFLFHLHLSSYFNSSSNNSQRHNLSISPSNRQQWRNCRKRGHPFGWDFMTLRRPLAKETLLW